MRPGERIGGYEVEARLGAGGMGAVFRAVHAPTGVRRALKVLTTEATPELLERFVREGEALARVDDHPNIVRVHAAGQVGGKPYLVMELCTGGDLAGRLRKGPLPPAEAARLVADVARGVAHIHARGIVHRDLKPHNVLFDEEGRPRVSDFGLAQVAGARTLTATGAMLGTPAYMAPEQAGEGRVDHRADVWALGGLLIAALTARPPYEAASDVNVVMKLLREEPRWPSSDRPQTPPDLEAIVRRAMRRRLDDRYPDASAMADDLERFLRGEPVSVAPPLRGRRWAMTGAAVAALCAGGALVAWWTSSSTPGAPAPSAPPSAPASAPPAATAPQSPAPLDGAPPSPRRSFQAPRGPRTLETTALTYALAFLDHRRLVASTLEGLILLDLDANTRTPVTNGPPVFGALALVRDRLYATGGGVLRVFHIRQAGLSPAAEEPPEALRPAVRLLLHHDDVLGFHDGSWDLHLVRPLAAEAGRRFPARIASDQKGPIAADMSPRGDRVARVLDTEDQGSLLDVHDVRDGRLVWTLRKPSRWSFRAVCFTTDDQLLVGLRGGVLLPYRVTHDDGEQLEPLRSEAVRSGPDVPGGLVDVPPSAHAHSDSLQRILRAPSGRWVWTMSDHELQVWEITKTGRVVWQHCLASPGGETQAVALSPDGRRLARAITIAKSRPSIEVWDVDD